MGGRSRSDLESLRDLNLLPCRHRGVRFRKRAKAGIARVLSRSSRSGIPAVRVCMNSDRMGLVRGALSSPSISSALTSDRLDGISHFDGKSILGFSWRKEILG